MSDKKHNHILGLLKSWQSGYISPSAQMAIKDGIAYIEELYEVNHELRKENEKLKAQSGKHREVEF